METMRINARKLGSFSLVVAVLGIAASRPGGLWAVQAGGAKKSDAVVKTTAEATLPDQEGKQRITVTMEIDPGWHIYANPVGNEDLKSVETRVMVDGRLKASDVKVEYPAGREIDDKLIGKYRVYDDRVQIKVIVKRNPGDTGPFEVTAKFQACTEKQCLLPATVRIKTR